MNARARSGVHAGNQELSGGRIEIRHAISNFAFRSHHRPSQPEVQRQPLTYAPIVLHEWAIKFPAASGVSAAKLLVVERDRRPSCQEIRCGIVSELPGDHPESVRETNRDRVQLIRAKIESHADIVVAPNHIQRIRKSPNVCPADEGRVPAIAQRPVLTEQFHRRQAATVAAQIGVRNTNGRRRNNWRFLAK